jgi:alpha-ribazole phosphatase
MGTMTRLILVRHGETDWNVAGRYQGQADPPLNANGQARAKALAAQLAGTRIEAIYSSDLQRARETAEIIARRLGLTVKLDRRLREINQGEWEGLLVTEVTARYPLEWAARENDPLGARAPGGESVVEVAARVWAAADEIARAHPVGPVLIVSHGLALATLLCRVRGVPLQQARDLILDNAKPEMIKWRVT